MIWFFIALACMALAVLVVLWIAPEGWEDEHGFHYGAEPLDTSNRGSPGATPPDAAD